MDNQLILPCDVSQVSDGYHTFEELYEHRCLLWINLLNLIHQSEHSTETVYKTRKDDRDNEMEGWFIAALEIPGDMQLTYHLPEELWPLLNIPEMEKNLYYDGHTSKDVADRLTMMATASLP
ncbi:MAG: hypothetical protein ACR2PX_03735 [Endozoicomonas sp.]|uniref:WDGH domain-containing protein n=1 Tax=Endozoicomonas sp. TaxID=1892382 RepID=UPI003D9B026E